jgi:hypothetical protein
VKDQNPAPITVNPNLKLFTGNKMAGQEIYHYRVHGNGYYLAPAVARELPLGFHLDAVPDPANIFDPNAVELRIGGELMGFIPTAEIAAHPHLGGSDGWYIFDTRVELIEWISWPSIVFIFVYSVVRHD